MNTVVRPTAKITKAAEIYRMFAGLTTVAGQSAQNFMVTLQYQGKKLDFEVTSQSDATTLMQTFLRVTGETLTTDEVKTAVDLAAKTGKSTLHDTDRIQHSVEHYNEVSLRAPITTIAARNLDGEATYRLQVPEGRRASAWSGFFEFCSSSMHANREYIINTLYTKMDAYLQELKSITSKQLQEGEHLEELFSLTDGLRTLIAEESMYVEEGFISKAGHVTSGLIGFSSVLKQAERNIGNSLSEMPQKQVLAALRSALEHGEIPERAALVAAWDDGVRNAPAHHSNLQQEAKVATFREGFAHKLDQARRDPLALMKLVREFSGIANSSSATGGRQLSDGVRDTFNELYRQSYQMKVRYCARHDGSATAIQLETALDTLIDRMREVMHPGFDPSSSINRHMFANIYRQTPIIEAAYSALINEKAESITEDFMRQMQHGERGCMQWTASAIAHLADEHPAFAITHIPSIYHMALKSAFKQVMEQQGFTGEKLVEQEHEAPSTRFMLRNMHQLHEYLHTGNAPDGVFTLSEKGRVDAYDGIREATKYFDGGHDNAVRQNAAVQADITASGSAVMVPDTHVAAGDNALVQGIESDFDARLHEEIARAGKGDDFRSKIIHGADAFSMDFDR